MCVPLSKMLAVNRDYASWEEQERIRLGMTKWPSLTHALKYMFVS